MSRAIIVLLILQQLEQHIRKSSHRADRQAIGFARQWRQSVERSENIGGSIDQNDVRILIKWGCSAHNAASARQIL